MISLDCSKCGTQIGNYVSIKDREYLHVGGLLCREAHGVCIQCGKEFHWSVPDRILGKIIKENQSI